MNKLKNTLTSPGSNKDGVAALLGIGILIGGGIGAYLYFSNKAHPLVKDEGYDIADARFDFSSKLKQLKENIANSSKSSMLGPDILRGIHELSAFISKKDFFKFEREARIARRAFIDNHPEMYAETVIKNIQEQEILIDSKIRLILSELNVNYEWYAQSVTNQIQLNSVFINELEEIFKETKRINANKDVKLTKDQIIEMFNWGIQNYASINITVKAEQDEFLGEVRQSYLADKMAMKYNVEEEDLLNHKDLIDSPEVQPVYFKYLETLNAGTENAMQQELL